MLNRHVRHEQAGFSLIELMVVLVILSIVGAIIAAGLTRGLRASNEAQARIEAFEDMQIALERVSRDLRGAAPLRAIEGADIEGADWGLGEGIEFERLRDGQGDCARYTYWLEDGALWVSEARSAENCASGTFAAPSERVLVPRLDNETVFTFSTYDDDGERIPVVNSADIADISIVTITFTTRPFDQATATVRTDVGLRNAS